MLDSEPLWPPRDSGNWAYCVDYITAVHTITSNYLICLSDFQRGGITSPSVVTLQASHQCGKDATSKFQKKHLWSKSDVLFSRRTRTAFTNLTSQFWVSDSRVWKRDPPPAWSRRFRDTKRHEFNMSAGAPCSSGALLCPPPVCLPIPKKKKKMDVAGAINHRGGQWNVKLNGIWPLTPSCCGKRVWTCELRWMACRTRQCCGCNCQVAANWFKWRMMGWRSVDAGSPLNKFKAQGAVYYPPVKLHYVWKCWPDTPDGKSPKYSGFISSQCTTRFELVQKRQLSLLASQ